MKKNILMLSALFLSTTALAQTDVTTGVMRGKDYGVTYMLPKTEIEIVLQATKHTYTPGEFCRYADRYLRLNNVSAEPEEFWTLDKIETRIAGVPDKDIYSIRESKNALLRGEADNMPKDGAQLKLMLDNLNQQETAMTEMFSGKIKKEPKTFTIRLTPKEMKDEVAFRFSRKLGVVANNDLAGEPYYISVTDLKSPDVSATEEGKKKVDGVAYNLPGKAQVTLVYNNKKLFDDQLPITQFGTVEYLAPVLFNKNSTIKVLFDTATGGLIKVDRE